MTSTFDREGMRGTASSCPRTPGGDDLVSSTSLSAAWAVAPLSTWAFSPSVQRRWSTDPDRPRTGPGAGPSPHRVPGAGSHDRRRPARSSDFSVGRQLRGRAGGPGPPGRGGRPDRSRIRRLLRDDDRPRPPIGRVGPGRASLHGRVGAGRDRPGGRSAGGHRGDAHHPHAHGADRPDARHHRLRPPGAVGAGRVRVRAAGSRAVGRREGVGPWPPAPPTPRTA